MRGNNPAPSKSKAWKTSLRLWLQKSLRSTESKSQLIHQQLKRQGVVIKSNYKKTQPGMRIARKKTAWVGGLNRKRSLEQEVVIWFLRSENKIYKSQTLHNTGCTRTIPMLWIRLQLTVLPWAQGTAQPQLLSTTQSSSVAWYQTAGTVRPRG